MPNNINPFYCRVLRVLPKGRVKRGNDMGGRDARVPRIAQWVLFGPLNILRQVA